jgi:hypothetical protein
MSFSGIRYLNETYNKAIDPAKISNDIYSGNSFIVLINTPFVSKLINPSIESKTTKENTPNARIYLSNDVFPNQQ